MISEFSAFFRPKVNSIISERLRDIYISKTKKGTRNNIFWGKDEALHDSRFYETKRSTRWQYSKTDARG